MPTGLAIDLGSPFFWIFLAGAVVVLLPVTDVTWRRRLLAVANLAFIGAVAGVAGAVAAGAFAFLLRAAAAAVPRWKRPALIAAASMVAGMFACTSSGLRIMPRTIGADMADAGDRWLLVRGAPRG